MRKKLEIKKKFINHFMKNGKKTTSEKILLNSLKELQKVSSKQSEELIKNALVNSLPVFTIHKIENKKQKKKKRKIKEIPFFIVNSKSRISLAIKLIIESLKKQACFFKDFNKEILANNQQKGDSTQLKAELQKKVIYNKRYFRFYRWR
jgi:ribosomal protein S7